NLASGVQNWRFVYKYAVFNLQTSISPYKLASRITTQHSKKYQHRKTEKNKENKEIKKNQGAAALIA
ncbi:hypothetical protein ACTQ1N_10630, partial [Porcincola sp. LCP21S3_C12]|uniref:hypothetical protein n=1 Tax=Porcincola sp. LCP21S3_C12 TaxID=3438798 RepID=UPI003F9B50DB